ncbi:hypothetical protein ACVOMV_09820 [Mesorhizobium atlanticum]
MSATECWTPPAPAMVFTSPTPDQMLAAVEAVDTGAGCTVHRQELRRRCACNFDMAAEMADGVLQVVTNRRRRGGENSSYTTGRRRRCRHAGGRKDRRRGGGARHGAVRAQSAGRTYQRRDALDGWWR